MLSSFIQQLHSEGSLTLSLRVRPGARKTEVMGIMGDGSIKIGVRAKAEEGAANEEVVRFLAEIFGVIRSQVSLLSGQRSRLKVARIVCGNS